MEQSTFNLRNSLQNEQAKQSLDKLIRLGCKEEILQEFIGWLVNDHIEISWPEEGRPEASPKSIIIPTKPLNSIESACDPGDGKHSFTIEELEQIAGIAEKLKEKVLRLADTYLVAMLRSEGKLGELDILNIASLNSLVFPGSRERRINEMFRGLLSLPDEARNYGKKKNHDTTYLLIALIEYVEGQTGQPHYDWVEEILSDIAPGKFCKGNSPGESLKGKYNYYKKRHPADASPLPKFRRMKSRK